MKRLLVVPCSIAPTNRLIGTPPPRSAPSRHRPSSSAIAEHERDLVRQDQAADHFVAAAFGAESLAIALTCVLVSLASFSVECACVECRAHRRARSQGIRPYLLLTCHHNRRILLRCVHEVDTEPACCRAASSCAAPSRRIARASGARTSSRCSWPRRPRQLPTPSPRSAPRASSNFSTALSHASS